MFNFKKFTQYTYSPLATVPILGFIIFVALPIIVLSLLNSRTAFLTTVIGGFMLFPFILSIFHQLNFWKLGATWILFFVISFLTLPHQLEGNQKLAVADHFTLLAFIPLFFLMIYAIAIIRKNKVYSNI